MTDITFRLAGPKDARDVVDLIEAAYRNPHTAGQWDSESHILTGPRTSLAEVEGLIARADSRFLLAEREGRIVGCALIQRTGAAPGGPDAEYFDGFGVPGARGAKQARPDGPACYFGMFAIDPDTRSTGLGKLVLAEAEAAAVRIWRARAMQLTVISLREPLMEWYKRRGYAHTGRRLPFPFTETSGETRRDFDLVEMRKPLV